MHTLTRHILGQLTGATLSVTLALTFAIWLMQSLRLLDYIVNRGLQATTFLYFVALLLPSFLSIVLPIAAFCATLFVYYKLTADRELIVMRSAGFSQVDLARPAMILATAITIIGYAISVYFLPISHREFRNLKYQLSNEYSAAILQEGVFNTLTEGITIFVRERSLNGELRGILAHDNRDLDNPVTMMAESGALRRSDEGPHIVLENGNRQVVDLKTGRLQMLYFDSYSFNLSQFETASKERAKDRRELTIPELLSPDTKLPARTQRTYIAEAHQRMVYPLYSIAFVLVALAALLSGEFSRRGQVQRVVVAIFCVASLQVILLTLNDYAKSSLSIVPAIYATPLSAIAVSLIFVLRDSRRRAVSPPSSEAMAGS
ncbi:LPS export ABC transporter permease LptF [Pelagibius sp. Alg239-R121]|uniref:LPS export ABC transporter permease LptF n=1 Tax=Pelagibius sp. Alg239-R121 TaxID=2993448 RepID=UPI0024A6F31A|nr:LPS export ABC transporter permease LptF [Pelagibius sp. Alg239-R121]